jgi:uncharacterized damage-inducible protein DinB
VSDAADLQRYLQSARDAMVWKLEGLTERQVRQPMTPTGTNLLGLVKHVAGVEAGYFGEVFDRPFPESMPWLDDDAEPNADMYATSEEATSDIIDLYRRVWAHSDATLAELPLDAHGEVPWWPQERRDVTLGRIAVHVIADIHRHAGHADILREAIDGASGLRADNTNLPDLDWAAYHARLEAIAASFDD